jgi:hypothetical protein
MDERLHETRRLAAEMKRRTARFLPVITTKAQQKPAEISGAVCIAPQRLCPDEIPASADEKVSIKSTTEIRG